MPTQITGTDTYPTSFNVPSGGDRRDAASVNAALEALANRTAFSRNRLGNYRVIAIDEFRTASGTSLLATSMSDTWSNHFVGSISEQPGSNDIIELIANPIALRGVSGPAEFRFKLTTGTGAGPILYSLESRVQLLADMPGSTMVPVGILGLLGPVVSGGADIYLQCRSPGGGGVEADKVYMYGPCVVIAKLWRAN